MGARGHKTAKLRACFIFRMHTRPVSMHGTDRLVRSPTTFAGVPRRLLADPSAGTHERCPMSTLSLPDPDWDDEETVLALVARDAFNLAHASPRLRGLSRVVLAAVRSSGAMLNYAAPPARTDPEVVAAAIENRAFALLYAPPSVQSHKPTVLDCVRRDASAFCGASAALRGDPEVVLAAIGSKSATPGFIAEPLRYTSARLLNDRSFLLRAARQTGVLKYARPRFKDDKEVVLQSVARSDYEYPNLISERLQKDPDVIITAVRRMNAPSICINGTPFHFWNYVHPRYIGWWSYKYRRLEPRGIPRLIMLVHHRLRTNPSSKHPLPLMPTEMWLEILGFVFLARTPPREYMPIE